MTGSRIGKPPNIDRFYTLAFLALLIVPANIAMFALFSLFAVFLYWIVASIRPLGLEHRRLFIRTALHSAKIQKFLLSAVALWLLKCLLDYTCMTFSLGLHQAHNGMQVSLLPLFIAIWAYMTAAAAAVLTHHRLFAKSPRTSISKAQTSAKPELAANVKSLESACNSTTTATVVVAQTNILEAVSRETVSGEELSGEERTRTEVSKNQLWVDRSLAFFNMAYLFVVCLVAFGETGGWFNNWFLASARDAHLQGMDYYTRYIIDIFPARIVVHLPEAMFFEYMVKTAFAAILWLFTSSFAGRLSLLLVSSLKKGMAFSTSELCEAPAAPLLESLRMKRSKMKMSEANSWFKHTSASFWWILSCYLLLFWIFGLMGGPLGNAICQWFDCSLTSAHFGVLHVQMIPPLHWFCGALVALYGTVPLAITGSIFLPLLKRKQIIVDENGMFLPDGPRFALLLRTFRIWDDFKSIELLPSKETELSKRAIKIEFHSGGNLALKVSQLSASDLHNLLSSVDENASYCALSDEILASTEILAQEDLKGAQATELRNRSADNYMSTVFVPLQPGDYIKGRLARIVRLLASKPLAAVYLARDKQGRFLIVKQFFMADETKETQALRKIFEQECEILQKLRHPRIARVVKHFQDGSSSFLLLEHAKGKDLRSLVNSAGKKSEMTSLLWAEKLAEIMKFLHEQNPPVLHRDLTPDNIVIDDGGRLHLIDFGAAHQFLEGITGTMIGKQCYTAPEQLRGNASPRSDIYSFGCTLYFLLTGEDPIALIQCSPAYRTQVSPALDRLIRACTEFEECERIQSFAQVLDEIKQCRINPYWLGDQTAQLEVAYASFKKPSIIPTGESSFTSKTGSTSETASASEAASTSETASASEVTSVNGLTSASGNGYLPLHQARPAKSTSQEFSALLAKVSSKHNMTKTKQTLMDQSQNESTQSQNSDSESNGTIIQLADKRRHIAKESELQEPNSIYDDSTIIAINKEAEQLS